MCMKIGRRVSGTASSPSMKVPKSASHPLWMCIWPPVCNLEPLEISDFILDVCSYNFELTSLSILHNISKLPIMISNETLHKKYGISIYIYFHVILCFIFHFFILVGVKYFSFQNFICSKVNLVMK